MQVNVWKIIHNFFMNGFSQIEKSWNFDLEKVDRLKLKKVVIQLIFFFRSEEPVVPNMDISTGHVVLVSISWSSAGEDSLCEKVDDAHQKIWIKFL